MAVCAACGNEDRIWRRGRCFTCNLSDELDWLLGDGHDVRSELQQLRVALGNTDSPRAVLRWVAKPTVAATLLALGRSDLELTHAAIDSLGETKEVAHLRQVLVATGALPARNELLARLESWIDRQLDLVEIDEDRQVLSTFAEWWVLRRRRAKVNRRPVGSVDRDHASILRAMEFLRWLRQHDRPLAGCTQADVDLWLASGPASRRDARTFLRWAGQRRLCRDLEIALRVAPLPVALIAVRELTTNARRLLHDDGLPLVDRVAGLLVLLYGQPVTRIAALTTDRIGESIDSTTLRFGVEDVELVEPLGKLVRRLVSERPGRAALGAGGAPWLFPGGRPGAPISASRLGIRLRKIGVRSHEARTTLLIELGGELIPSVIADTLGLSMSAALRWVQAAAGNWNDYAASAASSTGNVCALDQPSADD